MKKMVHSFFLTLTFVFASLADATIVDNNDAYVSYPDQNPVIQVLTFKTYSFEPSAEGSEKYDTTTFERSSTRYVYGMLDLKNFLYQKETKKYKFRYMWFKSDDTLMGSYDTEVLVEKDWEYAYHYDGWGWAEAGNWPVGNYRVELWLDNIKVAVTHFTVIDK